jgi:hypothetical protein
LRLWDPALNNLRAHITLLYTQTDRSAPVLDLFVVLLPLAIVRSWVVDDAAITFAYARGYGFVSQPLVMPVEGYSNFAWLVVMMPFNALDMFQATMTPKLLSAVIFGSPV